MNPPPPLRFPPPSSRTSSPSLGPTSPTKIATYVPEPAFYDLTGTPTSPPTSPRGRIIPLASPSTSPSKRGTAAGLKKIKPMPPPSRRTRSATPSGILDADLEKFAEHCRAWYYDQDEPSGALMTSTLSTVPPSQRPPYSRIQAAVRSMYHRSVQARKTAEFQAHVSATKPCNSLLPHNRSNPESEEAKKERYDRFERFVRTWATHGMPGTTPFFEALWALLSLQMLAPSAGGAGAHRIEWELDDAVFKEAAGKNFMLEAVDVLKGVLGFEETPLTAPPPRAPTPSEPTAIIRSALNKPPHRLPREPSDPFLDNPGLCTSASTVASDSPATPGVEVPASPFEDAAYGGGGGSGSSQPGQEQDDDIPHLRRWTAPDLPNTEYAELIRCFPPFVRRRPLPHFSRERERERDVEMGSSGKPSGKEDRKSVV